MKYTVTETIDQPRSLVVEKFQDPEGVGNWMEGFVRLEHISGERGQVGARTNFFFVMRKKEVAIEETILEQDLPNQIKFAYQSPMAYNEVELHFEELAPDRVEVISKNYFKFNGGMRLFSWAFKSLFVKQSKKHLVGLKNWVESID